MIIVNSIIHNQVSFSQTQSAMPAAYGMTPAK